MDTRAFQTLAAHHSSATTAAASVGLKRFRNLEEAYSERTDRHHRENGLRNCPPWPAHDSTWQAFGLLLGWGAGRAMPTKPDVTFPTERSGITNEDHPTNPSRERPSAPDKREFIQVEDGSGFSEWWRRIVR